MHYIMTKPLGYYTSYTPGDGGLLGEIEEAWGSTLEKLRDDEKLWLIGRLANELWQKYPIDEPPRDGVELVADRAPSELSVLNQIGLINALISQTVGWR
jgi:hypothetical protein